MDGLKNVTAYINGLGIVKTNIGISDGKIEYIGNNESIIDNNLILSDNGILVAGFIDRHVHGASGFDCMDANFNALNEISKSLSKEGVTAFLPTTMTERDENIKNALLSISLAKQKGVDGAEIIGVHLEGPFISAEYAGAQDVNNIKVPSINLFEQYVCASDNLIKLVTIAPEVCGAIELIEYLNEMGVKTSVGHSSATYEQVLNGIKAGINSVTHTFNAQNKAENGVSGSAVKMDELYTEIICDLVHVSKERINELLQKKKSDKILLITDAMRAKNMSDGVYTLGGNNVYVTNGEARLSNGRLAGSLLNMNVAIKNMVVKLGVSFENAVDFATVNVANSLGITNKGQIKVGFDADFTLLDNDFNVLYTVNRGKIVYKK